jgi:hypothetical protein
MTKTENIHPREETSEIKIYTTWSEIRGGKE